MVKDGAFTKHCDGCSLYNVHIHISGLMHLFLALRKGRLAIGFYEAFHSQIEFLLLPLFSHALFFYHHMSQSGLGWAQLRLFLARFFGFYYRFDLEWNRKGHGKRGALDCPLLLLELYSNSIKYFQGSGAGRYYCFLFRFFTLHIFISLDTLHLCYISLVLFSILIMVQNSISLNLQITTFLINQVCPSRFLCIFQQFSYRTQCRY